MRDFLKIFCLLLFPAVLLILGGTYLVDRTRWRSEIDRLRPHAIADRALRLPAPDLRNPDFALRTATGSANAMQQMNKDLAELVSTTDKLTQRGLTNGLGFSPPAADLATMIMAWVALLWAGLLAFVMMIQKMASPILRQKLITGSTGAAARSGGVFEPPH